MILGLILNVTAMVGDGVFVEVVSQLVSGSGTVAEMGVD